MLENRLSEDYYCKRVKKKKKEIRTQNLSSAGFGKPLDLEAVSMQPLSLLCALIFTPQIGAQQPFATLC